MYVDKPVPVYRVSRINALKWVLAIEGYVFVAFPQNQYNEKGKKDRNEK